MKKYNKCNRCGGSLLQFEDKIVPVQHSFLDSLGRVLLLFIPIIGWAALLSRKNFINETYAICKKCGYRKDLTIRTSLLTKIVTIWFVAFVVVFLFGMIMMTLSPSNQ